MDTKRTKYDTNPLDPDVERNAEEEWGDAGGGAPTQQVKGATRKVGADSSSRESLYSEAPTRRYDGPSPGTAYPSVFIPPTYAPPAQQRPGVQPSSLNVSSRPTARTVLGIGVPEKWAVTMPYAPYLGIVVSLLELFLVPRKEVKVRFHASQALSLHIAILIIQTIFGGIAMITTARLA